MVWWSNNVGSLWLLLATVIIGIAGFFVLRWRLRQRAQERLAASGIDEIDAMTGEDFERFLAAHFGRKGYRTEVTPKAADFGGDLIIKKDGRTVVVQAKRWNSLVGIESVQQVLGAINHYGADTGIVVTNSDFTENAYELAKKSPVELWNRTRLTEDLMRAGGRLSFESVNHNASDSRECPKCGGALVVRSGRRGRFWGCSSFPKCRYTTDL